MGARVAPRVKRPVANDRVEPGLQLHLTLRVPQRVPGTDQALLDHVLGAVRRRVRCREGHEARPVAAHDLLERRLVAFARERHQAVVGLGPEDRLGERSQPGLLRPALLSHIRSYERERAAARRAARNSQRARSPFCPLPELDLLEDRPGRRQLELGLVHDRASDQVGDRAVTVVVTVPGAAVRVAAVPGTSVSVIVAVVVPGSVVALVIPGALVRRSGSRSRR